MELLTHYYKEKTMSKELTLLGNKNTKYDFDYTPDVLETFDNKHPENDYFVKFNCLKEIY